MCCRSARSRAVSGDLVDDRAEAKWTAYPRGSSPRARATGRTDCYQVAAGDKQDALHAVLRSVHVARHQDHLKATEVNTNESGNVYRADRGECALERVYPDAFADKTSRSLLSGLLLNYKTEAAN
jgi:hypothetical protein